VIEGSFPLRVSRPALLLLLFILICGAALRFISLPHEALEGDELFSRRIVLLSPSSEMSAIRTDLVHPPLYYLLLQATTKIWGVSAVGVRAFSLLCGIVSIGLIAFLGLTLPEGRYAGMLAAALLALNQTHIFYSQEARSYAWYALVVLLLLLWVWRITDLNISPPSMRHWVIGTLLMIMLVYTHYVGAIYVGCAVLAIIVSKVPGSRCIASLACGAIAAASFIPWLVAIAGVYRDKHGVGENLDWQGHPTFSGLNEVYVSALGDLNIHGSSKLVVLTIFLLVLAALLLGRQRKINQSPIVLALLFLSILPPLIVFFLSRPPINLPLFGLRHCLPSIPPLILLCCYGVNRLAEKARPRFALVFGICSTILLILAAIPSLRAIASQPSRIPYDVVSQEVAKDRGAGIPAYAVWFYGVGEPVNFYCVSPCVSEIPQDHRQLPSQIVVLFRSGSSGETQKYRQLQDEGFRKIEEHYYSDGRHSIYGTTVAVLKRPN
jgi:hypothetical protein